MDTAPQIPVVLCLSGHDPTGGAGLQADVEAVAAQGAHALGVITALTVQDTVDVRRVVPVAVAQMAEQLDVLLADCRIDAIKIGLVGDAAQVALIRTAIERCAVPAVLDPVLRAGGGSRLAGDATTQALLDELLPRVTVATPNAAEARRLAPGHSDLDACAAELLSRGCRNLLVTGGDEPTADVVNSWHRPGAAPQRFVWPRRPGGFHGAGCTLAAALAARLAHGEALARALRHAQAYVQASLDHPLRIGRGRAIPRRSGHA
ncbi:hydroxymethylpyrimidine/phosphomethylpyrimidine kinase [Fontimonas sp. SYSU GA230001]|uniref:bifunctional hydroxymethylpyrimidine kinase/phosphomethylpyrimidine kinase n=1 Tax=Fontimonas sp. SYSU GA230001 TaxID=3142450 RepID=UPI0032B4EDF3